MVSVPAFGRAARILGILAQRSPDRLTLTEIARAAGIHKATCATLLTTMVECGFLSRDSDLRYLLGPATLAPARGYLQGFPALVGGRRPMVDFIAATGLSCAMIGRDGDELIVLEMLGNEEPPHLYMRQGSRLPLEPPLGNAFKAWSPADEQYDWLKRTSSIFGGKPADYAAALERVRRQGYSLGGEFDLSVELASALTRAQQEGRDSSVLQAAISSSVGSGRQLEPTASSTALINTIIVPVFDRSGRVTATLDAYGDFGQLTQAGLGEVLPELLYTAVRITQVIRGLLPEGFPAVPLAPARADRETAAR